MTDFPLWAALAVSVIASIVTGRAAWRLRRRVETLERAYMALAAKVPDAPPLSEAGIEPDPDALAWATEWEGPRGLGPWSG
jgi:hypothetical protein